MICRKFSQRNPWNFNRWWRFVCSATVPPSMVSGAAARRANLELGSVSRAQDGIFKNPRTLFFPKNRCQESSWSIPLGIKRCKFTTQTMVDVPINGVVDVPLAQTGEGIAECELLKWFVQEVGCLKTTKELLCPVTSLHIARFLVLVISLTASREPCTISIAFSSGRHIQEENISGAQKPNHYPKFSANGSQGEEVEEFQQLCEVQSDKATIEITSRYKGRVSEVLHVPGNIVKVGETLLKMVVDDIAFSNQSSEASEVIKEQDSNITDLKDADSGLRKPKVGGVLSTPAVRNFAKQLGVNVEDVHGTGEEGRVLKEDILDYAARVGVLKESLASVNSSSAYQNLEGDQIFPSISSTYGWEFEDRTIPLRGFQRAMFKSMTLAAKIPHFHYVDEINCDALVELKASFQKENSNSGVKYTFLPVLIKSLSMALSKYPMLNSSFSEELQEVTLKGSHNIGIAMATPHGLVVPNIQKVQSLSILEVTKELARLQELALANKLSSDDISGGTISLSNIGAIGGKFGSPLINVPEVSIIAMGRIQKTPQFDEDGNVYPASIMTVNIGADHRVLDGATVAKFCNEWKLFIEKPELLMLHMR